MLTMRAMDWAALDDIDDVEPLNDTDSACIAEIFSVLKRHSRQDRFGLTLLHRHFDMAPDEVLREQVDPEERTLILKPVLRDGPGLSKAIQTSWKLQEDSDGTVMTWCDRDCAPTNNGHVIVSHKQK